MLETSYRSHVFLGVHFVLFGFDPISENKVRFKLLNGGGVDVSQYNRSCTHVIVDKLVYDDPLCVAARSDGKTLVTALWVDHSSDIGMPVDPTSVMYRPLKDLNGIPAAKNVIVCLTGYQRHDRDDIMTMVGLMGAEFSKPLVANKVTHLICYKFEGDKYNLARKVKTIKRVNHRWLEDCLKHWVLLPEDKYKKSGYDLEMVEVQAQDFEEGYDFLQGCSGKKNINKSPLGSKNGPATTHDVTKTVRVATSAFQDCPAPEDLQEVNKVKSIPTNKNTAHQTSSFDDFNDLNISFQDPGASRHASCDLPDANVKVSEPRKTKARMAFGFQDVGISGNENSSGQLSDVQVGTSESRKLVNDLMLTSESAEGFVHSDEKMSPKSHSKKDTRRFSLPRTSDESSGNVTGSSLAPLHDLRERITSPCIDGSGKENDFTRGGESISLPQKWTTEASHARLKSRKISPDVESSLGRISSANGVTQGLKLSSFINEPPETGDISADEDGVNKPNTSSKCVSSESAERDYAHQDSARTSVNNDESKINGKPDKADFIMGGSCHDGNEIQQQSKKDFQCSSPNNKKLRNEESSGLPSMVLCNDVTTNLCKKSPRKKTFARKSLGSRPKLRAATQLKGSVCLNKTTPQGGVTFSSGCQEKATCDSEKLPVSSGIVDVEISSERENVSKSAEKSGSRIDFMDDEKEVPEDKHEYVVGMALKKNKSELVGITTEVDKRKKRKSEEIYLTTKCEEERPAKVEKDVTKQHKAVCKTNLDLVESISKMKEKNKGKKRPAGRIQPKTALQMDASKPEEDVDGIKINDDSKDEAEKESLKKLSVPTCRNDASNSRTNKPDNFFEVDKENRPIDREQDKRVVKRLGNLTTKSSVWPAKINQEAGKAGLNSSVQGNTRAKTKAACFILSGHRLKRKEFQQVIRCLKGRVCRDSHRWSYQATHFIALDPIRRTEKFFAAAASGRWILKMDYLTASRQEGKFLAEEPYEWHKNGFSEDGAINLEAPRRWRLLKERTGHGAFYGMRIIIYGECIAPPLDTLKRVIKAGDGTILATSPPYTRFLNTGIDYAIVSPGMARVDLWVQEFLKNEIPCILADYLVEYVCKPGFSLEKHVLYGTHSWAKRSYTNLQNKAEEIIEELFPLENLDDSDTICQVCGSRDRGEVMLICGDESGSLGCGIGTHIDCCNPPLKDVPQEDWFCPKCSNSTIGSNSSKKSRDNLVFMEE